MPCTCAHDNAARCNRWSRVRRRRHWPRKCGGSRATTLRLSRKLRWWKGLLQIMMGRDESPVDDHRERELGPTIRAPPPCTPSCEQVSSNWPLISCPVSLYAGETGGKIVCPVGIIKAVHDVNFVSHDVALLRVNHVLCRCTRTSGVPSDGKMYTHAPPLPRCDGCHSTSWSSWNHKESP